MSLGMRRLICYMNERVLARTGKAVGINGTAAYGRLGEKALLGFIKARVVLISSLAYLKGCYYRVLLPEGPIHYAE